MTEAKKFSVYGFFVWILTLLFFFYEFFLRVLPATISKNVIFGLGINIEQFAMIGSAYYITYSFMQIPVGMLLDRFSPRLLITCAVALCSFGALWFGFAQGFISAFIARLFIGLGSSFGFVGVMIMTLNWFPRKYFAFLLGWGQFLGAIGPLLAGGPIALTLEAVHGDWRLIFLGVALFGGVLTLLIALFMRGKPAKSETIVFVDKQSPLGKRLKTLLSRQQIWWILIYAATIYVALPLLGAFWGTAYLETRGFSKPTGAFLISMIWIGLAVGSPLLGKLSDSVKRRTPIIAICAATGLCSSLILLLTHRAEAYLLGALFFLIGVGASGQNLSFAIIAENAPKSLRATALGINNSAMMGFAAIIPPFAASIIQHFTVGVHPTQKAFEYGLSLIPISFAIALIVAIFGIRETFCRQQNEIHRLDIS